MAANNYFGFTHGGTQYGTTASGAYNHYAASQQQFQQAAPQGSYSNPTPAPTYGYGRPAQTYDTSKTYYQQTAGYTGGGSYEGAGSAKVTPGGYQASATSYAQSRPGTAATGGKVAQYNTAQQYVTPSNYSQPTAAAASASVPKTSANTGAGATYSNYDAALYSATSMYVAQQGAKPSGPSASTGNQNWHYKKGPGGGSVGGSGGAAGNGISSGGGAGGKMRFKQQQQAKPQQLHYCEVCKISCAGPQTYREHLDGQKHKKRQASLKLVSIGGTAAAGARGNMHCELCGVACTGMDAFAAHVRGSKHQKVVKLHQKLGKPIPEQDIAQATKKVAKINFVSESRPSMAVGAEVSVGGATTNATVVAPSTGNPIAVASIGGSGATVNAGEGAKGNSVTPSTTAVAEEVTFVAGHDDIKPVGSEYIEEIREDDGKILSFNCKLCECKFNDPNAKEMHMKGRRHRLQYKKKVQPDLVVDIKPSPRRLKLAEAKAQREMWNRNRRMGDDEEAAMDEEERMMFWEERRRYEEECWMQRSYGGAGGVVGPMGRGGAPPAFGGMFPGERRPESSDDRHVVAKHAEIYPKEEELQVIQRIVSHTERALKFVSDALAGPVEKKAPVTTAVKETATEGVGEAAEKKKEGEDEQAATTKGGAKEDGRDNQMFSFQKDADGNVRHLKGVMRVGLLAKGLLLQGDNLVQLVVLCAEKPTQSLLRRVANELPVQLANISTEHKYNVTVEESQGAVVVTDGQITVKVSLTSPILREQHQHASASGSAGGPAETPAATTEQATVVGAAADELLPREPCLAALAALRHAKWFQARATILQSCVMVMRVFRDLCQRTPTWNPIPQWAMELLIEKVIVSAGMPLSPGDCMRRIMEAVASGIFGYGPGIMDPCEKEPTDALATLSMQQREDITVSGQHYLRLIAFRQIYTVLNMEMLPVNKFQARPNGSPGGPWRVNRKRRATEGVAYSEGDVDSGGKAPKMDEAVSASATGSDGAESHSEQPMATAD